MFGWEIRAIPNPQSLASNAQIESVWVSQAHSDACHRSHESQGGVSAVTIREVPQSTEYKRMRWIALMGIPLLTRQRFMVAEKPGLVLRAPEYDASQKALPHSGHLGLQPSGLVMEPLAP